jgi:aspartyl-tRNA(Asn)/glutamyl-tRNA(Gln) amidotransferase subunit A
MSATQLLDAYAKKSLSPVEVTLTALDRIEKLDSMLNAFCFLDGEAAIQSARASEARWMRGTPIGVIDGVTATIKDVVLTKGWPTRKGSRAISADGPWTEDSPATARLREHGAVILARPRHRSLAGRSLAIVRSPGSREIPGRSTAPPGGSSAGAAPALAAGMGSPRGRQRRQRLYTDSRQLLRHRRHQANARTCALLSAECDGHSRALRSDGPN